MTEAAAILESLAAAGMGPADLERYGAVPAAGRAAALAEKDAARCAGDVVYWLDNYGWTCDQRKNGPGERFRPWPKQVEFLRWLEERERAAEPEEGRGDGLVEKSRDAGMTWLCCAFALHRWLFRAGCSIGFGSVKLDRVDDKSNPDCIFEKIRFLLYRLPAWMLPAGFRRGEHDNEAKLINPANGATITGEGGNNIGRGGRKWIYFVDEAAHLEHAESVERALSYTTRCQIDVSSVNGMGNVFARKRHSGRVPVFVCDWKDDPRKNRTEALADGRVVYPWEEAQKRTKDPVTLAQEVYRDYTASVEGICIPGVWVRAAVGLQLPGVEAFDDTWGGLDVGGGTLATTMLAVRKGPRVLPLKTYAGPNVVVVAWRVKEDAEQMGVQSLALEHTGVGVGPKGTWESAEPDRRPHFDVRALNTGSPATLDKWPDGRTAREKFLNIRAEAWWGVRERFRKTHEWVNGEESHPVGELISIPDDPELIAQLSTPLAEPAGSGRVKVESKKDMRRRGVSSPDKADAVVLSFFEGKRSVYESRGIRFLGDGPMPTGDAHAPAGAAGTRTDPWDDRFWGGGS